MSIQHLMVHVSCSSIEETEKITDALIASRLAACVNRIGPIQSSYEWQGTRCQDEEYLLLIKTRESKLEAVISKVKEIHSYKVSEIIAVPIVGGSQDYLNWVTVQTRETN